MVRIVPSASNLPTFCTVGKAVVIIAVLRETEVLCMLILFQDSFSLPKQFHSSYTSVFLRTCQVTREQEQSRAKIIWPAFIRSGLSES